MSYGQCGLAIRQPSIEMDMRASKTSGSLIAISLSCIIIFSSLGRAQEGQAGEGAVNLDARDLIGFPKLPVPTDNPLTEQAILLGQTLFFDPILSADRKISCASCHQPEHGFASPEARPLGVYGRRALRHAPTLYNRGYGDRQRWDGLAGSLEEQVLLPIEDPNEMDLKLADAVQRIDDIPEYQAAFQANYSEGVSEVSLAKALASYVRSLTYGDSPPDRFIYGERTAMSKAELAGMWIYESKGRCWQCHSRPNFSDEKFHNTGVGVIDGKPEPGRQAVTGQDADWGAFKVPTLRGLTETAPYMHDGSIETLAEVIEFYRRGGNANSHLDPIMQALELSDAEANNLLAFLRSLSKRKAMPAESKGK